MIPLLIACIVVNILLLPGLYMRYTHTGAKGYLFMIYGVLIFWTGAFLVDSVNATLGWVLIITGVIIFKVGTVRNATADASLLTTDQRTYRIFNKEFSLPIKTSSKQNILIGSIALCVCAYYFLMYKSIYSGISFCAVLYLLLTQILKKKHN